MNDELKAIILIILSMTTIIGGFLYLGYTMEKKLKEKYGKKH
jgi:hypothetical protein